VDCGVKVRWWIKLVSQCLSTVEESWAAGGGE
jgi:hypothetical protein